MFQRKDTMDEHIFAAHIREDGSIQTIKEHLEQTAELARGFAEVFGGGDMAYWNGMLHDIGKYSRDFQKRIYGGKNRPDHATAGAQQINEAAGGFGRLMAYCIAGHHTGLINGRSTAAASDGATLAARLEKRVDDYDAFKKDIDLPKDQKFKLPFASLGDYGFSVAFYIRMLFSCLIDADYLNTEAFMSGGKISRDKIGRAHV